MASHYNTTHLTWRGNAVYLGKRRLSQIIQDNEYPNMWRVIEENGSLSDMANLTRARDAANNRALSILNRVGEG